MKNNLRVVMAHNKKNISDVAKETGISRTTLSALYHEKAKGITFEILNKLLNYFECSMDDLFVPDKLDVR